MFHVFIDILHIDCVLSLAGVLLWRDVVPEAAVYSHTDPLIVIQARKGE